MLTCNSIYEFAAEDKAGGEDEVVQAEDVDEAYVMVEAAEAAEPASAPDADNADEGDGWRGGALGFLRNLLSIGS